MRPWGSAPACRSIERRGEGVGALAAHDRDGAAHVGRSGRTRRGPSPCGRSRPRPRAGTGAAPCRRAGRRTRSRRRRAAPRARARRTAAWPRSWRTPRRATRRRPAGAGAPSLRGFSWRPERRVDRHDDRLVAVERAEAPGLGRLGQQQGGAARRVAERERAVELEAACRRAARRRRTRASRSRARRAPMSRHGRARRRRSSGIARPGASASGTKTWAWKPVAWARSRGGPSPPRSYAATSTPSVDGKRCTRRR